MKGGIGYNMGISGVKRYIYVIIWSDVSRN